MPVVKRRSLSLPIVLSVVSVGMCIALLVGWILVLLRHLEATKEVFQNTLLMVAGIVSFAVIMAVLVLFTVFLVREILEVRRQVSFIDSVTHELKSPLASLRLCVDTLGRRELDGRRRDELREMMSEDIQRLSAVIDGILEASRIEQGGRARGMAEVDLGNLVEQCSAVIRRRRKLEELDINLEIPRGMAVLADPGSLRTVLENLLDNAVKYSDASPRLRVTAGLDDRGRVRIDIADQGIGISRRDIERVFDRFYRAPEEEVRARYGTGLGLYVVAAIVRDMGGRIEAMSEGLGKGATLRITLPRRRVPADLPQSLRSSHAVASRRARRGQFGQLAFLERARQPVLGVCHGRAAQLEDLGRRRRDPHCRRPQAKLRARRLRGRRGCVCA